MLLVYATRLKKESAVTSIDISGTVVKQTSFILSGLELLIRDFRVVHSD